MMTHAAARREMAQEARAPTFRRAPVDVEAAAATNAKATPEEEKETPEMNLPSALIMLIAATGLTCESRSIACLDNVLNLWSDLTAEALTDSLESIGEVCSTLLISKTTRSYFKLERHSQQGMARSDFTGHVSTIFHDSIS